MRVELVRASAALSLTMSLDMASRKRDGLADGLSPIDAFMRAHDATYIRAKKLQAISLGMGLTQNERLARNSFLHEWN